MGIQYSEEKQIFKLDTPNSSYIFMVAQFGYLAHLYYGKSITDMNIDYVLRCYDVAMSPNPAGAKDRNFSIDVIPLEYSFGGTGDFRSPAITLELSDGSTAVELKYYAHKIYKGKPEIKGLPSTYAINEDETETLELTLVDNHSKAQITLYYTVFNQLDVITRHVKITNNSDKDISINRALSMSIDFDNCDYDFMHLYGAWTRERYVERRRLLHTKQSVDSIRGTSSSQHNPFIALLSQDATEDFGEVYGFNLVYSGNFLAEIEVSQLHTTRVLMGINPYDFKWLLKPGENFCSPEVVMVYSSNGLTEMTHTYHNLYRNHLIRGNWRDKKRPVLINNWEATYFDFDSDKLVEIAHQASELGIDMLVMDDGWFGKRDNDKSGLGDWFVNTNKIKGGLDSLVKRVNSEGLKFGIWFEPEMVSPDSDLYRIHPDWCIQIEGREMSISRNQYVLDMSRSDVIDYLFGCISSILSSANIEYVKWDMNRNITEAGSLKLPTNRQREICHRYILGVYELYDRLTNRFPNILFEGCASGGARFDPGILYYSPQIWASDDTDAIERLRIQYGTSMVYPMSAIGSHVSACPNHQTGRIVPFETRGIVALSGTFGYELDPTKITEEEKNIIKEQIEEFHLFNELIRNGDYYRLTDPFKQLDYCAWGFVSKDKEEILLQFVQVLNRPNNGFVKLKLKGLDKDAHYQETKGNETYKGDVLMNVGFNIPRLFGDFTSLNFHFIKIR